MNAVQQNCFGKQHAAWYLNLALANHLSKVKAENFKEDDALTLPLTFLKE